MPSELPLFPLNVVLFPGMQLPLHIFEPRYRLMMQRCLEGNRIFGVALLVEGREGQSGTLPANAGCTAEIVDVAPFSDGRLNLKTVGRRRFRILSLREEDDYFIGAVEWIDDEPSSPAATTKADHVRASLQGYLRGLAHNANISDLDVDDLDMPEDPYAMSMWVAALVSLPNPQKQELLELTSTEARLEMEYALLRRAEVVQRAFARRAQLAPTASGEDDPLGPLAKFVSLN